MLLVVCALLVEGGWISFVDKTNFWFGLIIFWDFQKIGAEMIGYSCGKIDVEYSLSV